MRDSESQQEICIQAAQKDRNELLRPFQAQIFISDLADGNLEDRQNDERSCAGLGDHSQLALVALGLVLAKEGFGAAADRAQSGGVALLHENRDDQNDRNEDQKNMNDNRKYCHR